jgi:hypothetical protein
MKRFLVRVAVGCFWTDKSARKTAAARVLAINVTSFTVICTALTGAVHVVPAFTRPNVSPRRTQLRQAPPQEQIKNIQKLKLQLSASKFPRYIPLRIELPLIY